MEIDISLDWGVITLIDFVVLLIGAISLGVAWKTAQSTADTVKEAHNNTQSQIANSLLEHYADPLTLSAIHELQDWHDHHAGRTYVSDFMRKRKKTDKGKSLDRARRRLAHYFQRAAIMKRQGLLDEHLLKEVISDQQIINARRYVEPLERAVATELRGHYESRDYDDLERLHSKVMHRWRDPDTPLL